MHKRQFSCISLGCAKNLVDSEEIIGSLISEGYRFHPDIGKADFVVINTCAFLREARLEALDTIKRIIKIKKGKHNKLEKIIVVGCLTQYFTEKQIKKIAPGVDLILPMKNYRNIPYLVNSLFDPQSNVKVHDNVLLKKHRFLSRSPHSVYIKIADGCDNKCSYCLIPSLRGPLRSKKIDEILAEVYVLRKLGVKEINLIAQDTTAYGLDLYGKPMIVQLLKCLCAVKGIEWIRLLYTHPAHISTDLLQIIQQEEAICNYLDLPIQHVSDKILRLMGRKTSKEKIIFLYHQMRDLIPEIVLRTTVMVGYPGEGEEEFNELFTFLREYPFERLGIFPFSPERGTAAFHQGEKVQFTTTKKRLNKIISQQKSISRSFNRSLLGKKTKILLDSIDVKRKKACGRLPSQAPEVDGKVFVNNLSGATPGDFLTVKIRGAGTFDLIGEVNQW